MSRKAIGQQEVAAGVFRIEVPTPFASGPANCYLIVEETVALVDTGPPTPEAWEALAAGVAGCGYEMGDIRQIVLTHHHIDHCGWAERVKSLSGAPVYAHPFSVPFLERDERFFAGYLSLLETVYRESGVPDEKIAAALKRRRQMKDDQPPCKVDFRLVSGQALPGHENWRVIGTPGHSQDHVSLYRASDRTMIGGDLLIGHMPTTAYLEPPQGEAAGRPPMLMQQNLSLLLCGNLDIRILLPGHGEPIFNHRELVQNRFGRFWHIAGKVTGILREGGMTAYEIAERLYPELAERDVNTALSETLGYLDVLMMLHHVKADKRNAVYRYSAVWA